MMKTLEERREREKKERERKRKNLDVGETRDEINSLLFFCLFLCFLLQLGKCQCLMTLKDCEGFTSLNYLNFSMISSLVIQL